MKFSCTSDELDYLEGCDDATLARHVRDSLAQFRSKGARDDLTNANPGTPSHSGPTTATLETPVSRAANKSTMDSAAGRLRMYGLSERRIGEILNPTNVSDADAEAAGKLIPGLGRLK